MKIVILEKEETLGIGGIIIHNASLRKYFSGLKHEVFLIKFSNNKKRGKNDFYIPYYIAEKRSYIFLPSEKTKTLLVKYLKKIKPDIVHFCIGISPFDLFIAGICHDLNIPIVGIWHGDITDGSSAFSLATKSVFLAYTPVVNQLDSLIVFSDKLKSFYLKRGVHIPISIIPNGINKNYYQPVPPTFTDKLRIDNQILFLGRLTRVKNPEVLLEAFLKINPDKNTKLIMAGTGDLEAELKNNYPDKRIIFTGLISNEEQKLNLIRSCKIFVLPSSYEGMSLALLEAMSCGLACIATDTGGHPELLKNAGIILPHDDLSHNLPSALKLLLDNPWLQKEFGKRARAKILKTYTDEIIMPQYLKLYEETIVDYQKRDYPKTRPIDLTSPIKKNLEDLWKKAKEFGLNYLFGDI